MKPHVVINFPDAFIADSDSRTSVRKYQWPVANNYEVFEQKDGPLIAPHPDCDYPEDFKFYDPGQKEIHKELLNIDNYTDPDSILPFIEKRGLLGTWFRGAEFEQKTSDTSGTVHTVINPRLKQEPITESSSTIEVEEGITTQVSQSQISVRIDNYFHPFIENSKRLGSQKSKKDSNKIFLSDEVQTTLKAQRFKYLGESFSTEKPLHGSIPKQLEEFQLVLINIQNSQTFELEDEFLPSFTLRSGIENLKGFNQSKVYYSVDSLLDVGIFQAHLNQENMNACRECETLFFPENSKANKQQFCTSKCRDNYNGRRNTQRKNWETFLKNNFPESADKWPEYDPPNPKAEERFRHPSECMDLLKSEMKGIAVEWAKKTKQRSTRVKSDPLLEPILKLEE